MKTHWQTMILASALVIGGISLGATSARAQAVGFGYTSPGFSIGVGTGGVGYYGAYPYAAPVMVAPAAPVVVAPGPAVIPAPVMVGRPYYYPRNYGYRGYGYRGYGYRGYGYRGYGQYYRHR